MEFEFESLILTLKLKDLNFWTHEQRLLDINQTESKYCFQYF